jgi:hypothetical protein
MAQPVIRSKTGTAAQTRPAIRVTSGGVVIVLER